MEAEAGRQAGATRYVSYVIGDVQGWQVSARPERRLQAALCQRPASRHDARDESCTARGWLVGIDLLPDGKHVYVGGGSRACVYEFNWTDGKLERARTFQIVPDDKRTHTDFIGDVAVSPDGHILYAAGLYHNAIHVINLQSGRVIEKFATGRRPYRVLVHPTTSHIS